MGALGSLVLAMDGDLNFTYLIDIPKVIFAPRNTLCHRAKGLYCFKMEEDFMQPEPQNKSTRKKPVDDTELSLRVENARDPASTNRNAPQSASAHVHRDDRQRNALL